MSKSSFDDFALNGYRVPTGGRGVAMAGACRYMLAEASMGITRSQIAHTFEFGLGDPPPGADQFTPKWNITLDEQWARNINTFVGCMATSEFITPGNPASMLDKLCTRKKVGRTFRYFPIVEFASALATQQQDRIEDLTTIKTRCKASLQPGELIFPKIICGGPYRTSNMTRKMGIVVEPGWRINKFGGRFANLDSTTAGYQTCQVIIDSRIVWCSV